MKKACGFSILGYDDDLGKLISIYGEVWSEEGEKLGSLSGFDVEWLREDLKRYLKDKECEYVFTYKIPFFLRKRVYLH